MAGSDFVTKRRKITPYRAEKIAIVVSPIYMMRRRRHSDCNSKRRKSHADCFVNRVNLCSSTHNNGQAAFIFLVKQFYRNRILLKFIQIKQQGTQAVTNSRENAHKIYWHYKI